MDNLVTKWLGAKGQTLGGNYGEPTPSDLGMTFSSEKAANQHCSALKDEGTTVYDNTISALTAVEMARRIVLHRDLEDQYQFPGLQWPDVQVNMIVRRQLCSQLIPLYVYRYLCMPTICRSVLCL